MRLTQRGKNLRDIAIMLIGGSILAAWLLATFTIGQNRSTTDDSGIIPPQVCVEDQGCWDCTTMGNKQCGP